MPGTVSIKRLRLSRTGEVWISLLEMVVAATGVPPTPAFAVTAVTTIVLSKSRFTVATVSEWTSMSAERSVAPFT